MGTRTTTITVADKDEDDAPVTLFCTDTATTGDTDTVTDVATAPPLLLLHGLAGHCGEWEELTARFADRHRVVAFDARGGGASTRRPVDVSRAAHVRDVTEVVRAFGLAAAGGPVLVGQSMGGVTALLTAAAHPELVRALVLIEAGPDGPSPSLPETIGAWLDSWPVPFPDAGAAAEFFGGGAAGRAWAAGLAPVPDGLYPRVDRDVMVATVQENAERDYWDAWDEVRCPVLVVRAGKGMLKQREADRMAGRHGTTRIAVVPEAGHDVHLDDPAAVYEEMAAFLAEVAGQGR